MKITCTNLCKHDLTLNMYTTFHRYNMAVYGCNNVTGYKCDAGQDISEFALFPRISTDPSQYYRDLAVLLSIFVGFRVLSCIILSSKASSSS